MFLLRVSRKGRHLTKQHRYFVTWSFKAFDDFFSLDFSFGAKKKGIKSRKKNLGNAKFPSKLMPFPLKLEFSQSFYRKIVYWNQVLVHSFPWNPRHNIFIVDTYGIFILNFYCLNWLNCEIVQFLLAWLIFVFVFQDFIGWNPLFCWKVNIYIVVKFNADFLGK